MAHLDKAPTDPVLTDCDREHFVLCPRLLDDAEDGKGWREVVRVLFEIDPATHPERARPMHRGHLGRPCWLSREECRQPFNGGSYAGRTLVRARPGRVMAATPMTTSTRPYSAVGAGVSPSRKTAIATPTGTRR